MTVLRLWSDLHRRTPLNVFVYEPFDFAEEYAAAKWEQITAHLKTPVVRWETLIAMERLAARPQDLADVAELEQIRELKESGHGERNYTLILGGSGARLKGPGNRSCYWVC